MTKTLSTSSISRREAFSTITVPVALITFTQQPALSITDEDYNSYHFENRDRKNNKDAIIREDYWFLTGKLPPRKLEVALNIDDPQFNAFGSCETTGDGGSNSCTYVSLKQRIPAYSKYGFSIMDGAKEYQKLGYLLDRIAKENTNNDNNKFLWEEAYTYVMKEERTVPPAIIDAELKMVLFATAMLTSPNFPKPGKELLIARFYVNEIHYAATTLSIAIQEKDIQKALKVWDFGKDSWNSFFQVVNKSISSKVGEAFPRIS